VCMREGVCVVCVYVIVSVSVCMCVWVRVCVHEGVCEYVCVWECVCECVCRVGLLGDAVVAAQYDAFHGCDYIHWSHTCHPLGRLTFEMCLPTPEWISEIG